VGRASARREFAGGAASARPPRCGARIGPPRQRLERPAALHSHRGGCVNRQMVWFIERRRRRGSPSARLPGADLRCPAL